MRKDKPLKVGLGFTAMIDDCKLGLCDPILKGVVPIPGDAPLVGVALSGQIKGADA